MLKDHLHHTCVPLYSAEVYFLKYKYLALLLKGSIERRVFERVLKKCRKVDFLQQTGHERRDNVEDELRRSENKENGVRVLKKKRIINGSQGF